MMIHHTLKVVAMSPPENLISYPPKLDELSIVDFAVHNAIQLRSQLGVTLFWGDNLVPKISFSVPCTIRTFPRCRHDDLGSLLA